MKLTELLPNNYQFNYDKRVYRYVDGDGKGGEWKSGEEFIWSTQELCSFLESQYPQYKDLELFKKIIEKWGSECGESPSTRIDIGMSLLKLIPRFQKELNEKEMPDIMKKLSELEQRIKILEENTTVAMGNKYENRNTRKNN